MAVTEHNDTLKLLKSLDIKRIKWPRKWSLNRTRSETEVPTVDSMDSSSCTESPLEYFPTHTEEDPAMIFERCVQQGPSPLKRHLSSPATLCSHSRSIPSHHTTESYTAPVLDATCELITGNDADLEQIRVVAMRRPSSILSSSGLSPRSCSRTKMPSVEPPDQNDSSRNLSFFSYAEFLQMEHEGGVDPAVDVAFRTPVFNDASSSNISEEEDPLSVTTLGELLRMRTVDLKDSHRK